MRFLQQGIGSSFDQPFDIIRCFNVLIYFDRSFRERTLEWVTENLVDGGQFLCGMNWVHSRAARYSVYQRVDGHMKFRELAISIDNIRPTELVPWFTLHEEDFETVAMVEIVRILRSDPDFLDAHDRRLDELLAEEGFCVRNASGNLGGLPENASPELMEKAPGRIGNSLEQEGYVETAVEVLRANGLDAWINCVGHIAVDPARLDIGPHISPGRCQEGTSQ